jgi:hypothetical protein
VAYRGKIEGGQGVTDPSDLLPEGASVSIEVIRPVPKVVGDEDCLDVIGIKAEGPTDLIGINISSDASADRRNMEALGTSFVGGWRSDHSQFGSYRVNQGTRSKSASLLAR